MFMWIVAKIFRLHFPAPPYCSKHRVPSQNWNYPPTSVAGSAHTSNPDSMAGTASNPGGASGVDYMVDLGAHPPYHPPPEGYRGGGGSDSSSDADSSMTSGSTSGSASGSSTSSGSTVTPPQAPGGLVDTHPAHQSHADIRNRNLNRSAIFFFLNIHSNLETVQIYSVL